MKFTLKIKKNRSLKYVLKKGMYKSGKYIVIHKLKTSIKYSNINFFAVCVSKKNGISVHRNKLKRWVREVYKIEEPSLKKGYNILILYLKNVKIEDVNFSKVQLDMKKILRGLDLYE